METIFVQIASYRDGELPKTIADCLDKASFPERLRFGICHQFDDDTRQLLAEYEGDNRFRITNMPWQEARGVGLARRICNSLYKEEDFTLQIDSHTRFAENWDEKVIQEWKKCQDERAVLSCYPPEYRYEDGKEVFIELSPSMLTVSGFHKGFIPKFKSKNIPEDRPLPYRVPFAAGGFQFSRGQVCKEVPYCKEICFMGEEIVHTLRLFTHGYRVYCPTVWILYHLYLRSKLGAHHFWQDFTEEPELKGVYEQMDKTNDQTVKDVLWGNDDTLLGDEATVQDFQKYAGIDFKAKIVHPDQLEALAPPYSSDDDWTDKVAPVRYVPVRLRINTADFARDVDYDFWYFALHDDNGELIRDDIRREDWKVATIEIDKEYPLRETPSKYVIWTHSKTKGWMEKKIFPLT